MNESILVIEDDKDISGMLKKHLSKDGYIVDPVFDGEAGLFQFRSKTYDLVILDIMMPKLNGIDVLKEIRKKNTTPVIILSAKDGELDKALGLGFGADDYLTKPFSLIELTARVQAILRRANNYSKQNPISRILRIDSLTVDLQNYSLKRDDTEIKITIKEFEILKLLLENPNVVFTKSKIYESIWKEEAYGADNIVNVHIRRLREKIEDDPSNPEIIKTVWGVGYKYAKR